MAVRGRVVQTCMDWQLGIVERNGYAIEDALGSNETWEAWYSTPKDTPENIQKRAKNKWLAELDALKAALQEALRYGKITQAEYDEALEKWLEEHPDPYPDPIEVTEEFAIGVPIHVPELEEVKEYVER